MAELTGKVVLITGGSRGIGAATVQAALDAEAEVVLHYGRNRAAAEAVADGSARCHLVAADFETPAAVDALWRDALAWKGRIDVLVNNAAVYEPDHVDGALDAWHAAWCRTLQVNLLAPAQLCRLAVAHYRARGGGALINIASRAAFRGEMADYGSYAASKGGLVALNHTIARAEAAAGVLAYAIAPGWVSTDMALDYVERTGDRSMLKDIPLGEMVPPEEVANLVVFLASGRARHVTGTTIDINGGSFPR